MITNNIIALKQFDLHIIREKDVVVAFYPKTNDIIKLNLVSADIFEDLLNKISIQKIARKYSIGKKDVIVFANSIINKLSDLDKQYLSSTSSNDEKHIAKLIIHVNNNCNLLCKYCYADHGSYNKPMNLMDEKTIKKTINIFFNSFHKVGYILFFGGEPFLDIDIIEKGCRYIHKLYNNRTISNIPAFGVVTEVDPIDWTLFLRIKV